MTCPFCTTKLPADSNHANVVCPKCGSAFTVTEAKLFDDSVARMLWFEDFMHTYEYSNSDRLQSGESC